MSCFSSVAIRVRSRYWYMPSGLNLTSSELSRPLICFNFEGLFKRMLSHFALLSPASHTFIAAADIASLATSTGFTFLWFANSRASFFYEKCLHSHLPSIKIVFIQGFNSALTWNDHFDSMIFDTFNVNNSHQFFGLIIFRVKYREGGVTACVAL